MVKTYREWENDLLNRGVQILDNDGFRAIPNFNYDMKFTQEDFEGRLMVCTLMFKTQKGDNK